MLTRSGTSFAGSVAACCGLLPVDCLLHLVGDVRVHHPFNFHSDCSAAGIIMHGEYARESPVHHTRGVLKSGAGAPSFKSKYAIVCTVKPPKVLGSPW